MEDLSTALMTAIGLVLIGIATSLTKFFKSSDYLKELMYQKTFGKPLVISLTNHPLFSELQAFVEIDQHYAHFSEPHRNHIFVNYLLVFTTALRENFFEFCKVDLDQQFETVDDFEAALQSVYNKTFGACLVEVKDKFTFNNEMLYKIQTHQEDSLTVFQLGIKRILNDTTFDHDRQPNKRKMWRILDSLAQSKDEYETRTKAYFKGLNGQMATVNYIA